MTALSKNKFTILLIFQGLRANRYVKHVRDLLSQREYCVLQTWDKSPNLQDDILSRFRTDVDRSDAAICIVTPDLRAASTAGNLWLEIGLWCGLKSEHTLLVCAQDSPKVDLPSDIRGRVARRFKTETELDDDVLRHIGDVYDGLSQVKDTPSIDDGIYSDHLKVRDTLRSGLSEQEKVLLDRCVVHGRAIDCQQRARSRFPGYA
jgi:hypothetical protein